MTVKSESGSLFVIAGTQMDRVTKIKCFDLIFGERGKTENLDGAGEKQRPHLVFYPDGNGAFIRLAGHDCEIESEMHYNSTEKQIVPSALRIKSNLYKELILIEFSMKDKNHVILDKMSFIETIQN